MYGRMLGPLKKKLILRKKSELSLFSQNKKIKFGRILKSHNSDFFLQRVLEVFFLKKVRILTLKNTK